VEDIDHLIVLDVETTGLADPIGVCEIGIIELHPETLEEVGRFQSLIDPEKIIEFGASGIHRITNDMVLDAPTLDEYFNIVLDRRYAGTSVLMVAHNAIYDYPKVKDYLGDSKSLCTLRLVRKVLPDAENHKLATLKYMLGLGAGGKSHSALADVEDCADLLRFLRQETGMSLAELVEFERKPIITKVMGFSKYKGLALEDVPRDFWVWLNKQKDSCFDPDFCYSVNQIHPTIHLKEKQP
jgi:DNA polymerase III epsilon subunit-like protein